MIKYITVLMFLTACGMKHKISGDVGVKVDVNHKIDLRSLNDYFKDQCRIKLIKEGNPTPTQSEIETCASDEVFKFLDAFEAAGA